MSNRTPISQDISIIYDNILTARRSSPLYSAFPYPTKIDPETIALFIATHSNPGDTIFDGFAGSGTTGIASILCGNPTQGMVDVANQLNLSVNWGARHAILYELSTLGSFITSILCSPPKPDDFLSCATTLLSQVHEEIGWMYDCRDLDNNTGTIRHTIWTEYLVCPHCNEPSTYWECCVNKNPAAIGSSYQCPQCHRRVSVNNTDRLIESITDELLKKEISVRKRRPIWLYGNTGKKLWSRKININDEEILDRIAKIPLLSTTPQIEIPWGDLYRNGYHHGISHLHHFYSRRNLFVFSTLWAKVRDFPSEMRDALKFWLLSYNASHSTLMTRCVAKKGQQDLVVTSAQPGVLYISGLPVEKNIFYGLQRKLKTILKAFEITHNNSSNIQVVNSSCLDLAISNEDVDYIFTDPPFGGNIPYAEVNFINEAWLGRITKPKDEVTISPKQHKTSNDYGQMLSQAFKELARIIKHDGKLTVVFHSSTADVWNKFKAAYDNSGFKVKYINILHKDQASFKQVTTAGSVRGDLVVLLSKEKRKEYIETQDVDNFINQLLVTAKESGDDIEVSSHRLFSRFITHFLSNNQDIPIDAEKFYRIVSDKLKK